MKVVCGKPIRMRERIDFIIENADFLWKELMKANKDRLESKEDLISYMGWLRYKKNNAMVNRLYRYSKRIM